jgi:hypothetical protein
MNICKKITTPNSLNKFSKFKNNGFSPNQLIVLNYMQKKINEMEVKIKQLEIDKKIIQTMKNN